MEDKSLIIKSCDFLLLEIIVANNGRLYGQKLWGRLRTEAGTAVIHNPELYRRTYHPSSLTASVDAVCRVFILFVLKEEGWVK